MSESVACSNAVLWRVFAGEKARIARHKIRFVPSRLGKKRVEAVGDVGQRIRGGRGRSLAVEVVPETVQGVAQTQHDVPGGDLPLLALVLHLGVVSLGGFLGVREDLGGVAEHVPGGRLDRLGREGDAAVDLVVIDDHALDGHAGLQDLLQILDAIVRDLGDVQKTGHAADLDEGTVRLEGLDHTVHEITSGEIGHLRLDDGLAVGDDKLVVLLVDLEELQRKLLSDELFGGHPSGQVGSGEEGAESLHQADGSTAVDADDLGLEDGVVGLHLQDGFPGGSVLDSSDRDQELTVLVLVGDDLEVELLVEVDEVVHDASGGLDEGGLGLGKVGGGLGTDVHDDALGFVFDALSLDDGVALEGVGGLGDGGGEIVVVEGEVLDGAIVDGNSESLVVLFQFVESGHLRGGRFGGGIDRGGVERRPGRWPSCR
mmetsp:Transcript_22636/g.53691  ORF Transcript_22636/g.53691 Transcript_22636/m.53691 type:complete len:429 (-) Transcript_22636:192-1478(-)